MFSFSFILKDRKLKFFASSWNATGGWKSEDYFYPFILSNKYDGNANVSTIPKLVFSLGYQVQI